MKLIKTATILILTGALTACGSMQQQTCTTCGASTAFNDANFEYHGISTTTEIYLQHPFTRVIARCYASTEYATNACAETFEQKGYVRFRNIPYKTAKYDFLKKDTYPTRRWREHEKTPRW
ncbi:MAG: hypothetical protein IJ660_03560 [Alphaproteobacteria bacterium]|nr:hypothetical protein [Alphaproteobacteria bacterium]